MRGRRVLDGRDDGKMRSEKVNEGRSLECTAGVFWIFITRHFCNAL